MGQTVADLLGGGTQSRPAPGDAPPPPPGFTVSEAPPPPPPGFTVQRPAPKLSAGEMVGMGVRGLLSGAGGLVDILAAPANATVNAATGSHLSTTPFRDAGNTAADAMGLATPRTDQERLVNAVTEGGTQGVLTAGAGMGATGAKGVAGTVARSLAANPMVDIVGSGAATGAQEKARQAGVGPVGQFAIGLAAGIGAGAATKGVAARFGPKAAKVVESVPPEAVFDEKGNLTDEGREVAAQNDLTHEQIKGAYEEAAKPPTQTVRTHEGVDHPVEVLDPAPVDHEGVPHVKVRGADGAEGYVPQADLREVEVTPARTAEEPVAAAPAASAEATPANDTPMPATAAARMQEAASEGVMLTKGQATKDFDAQSAENDLAATQSPAGQRVRDHFAQQAEQIKAAVERFKSAFGDPNLSATERGQQVKDALRGLAAQGKAGVTAFYEQARQAAEQLGEAGSNLIGLDHAPILARMRELFIDEGVDDGVRRALKQLAAKYGLIGENPRTVEGETTVTLRDSTGEPAGKITFTGPPRRLTITNAEDFRQAVSALYKPTERNQQESLKPLIEAAVQNAVERATKEAPSGVGQKFKTAREAHATQQKTFKSGDVVQDIIDWKKGQRGTDKINPEDIFSRIFKGGPEGLTNLRKVKAVLLSKPTQASVAAWKAIQAHAVAQLFNKATVINANLGESGLGAISGAKLNTEIAKFGVDKLKTLLSAEDFNQLMKLRRVISDATIPLKGTTNPSGSGHVVARFLAKQATALAPVAKIVPMLRDVVKGAEEFGARKAQRATLEGATNFTPEAAAAADTKAAEAADPMSFVRKFLNAAGSQDIIAPVLASAANEERPPTRH